MREEWIQTTLGDVAVLEYGKALKEGDRDGDGFPVFGSAGVVGWHSVPLVADGPVIIVGRKGTAGAVHWSTGPCSVIDTAYWVRITEAQLRTEFAHLVVSSLNLPSLSAQTGVPGLNRDRAYSQPVSVPTVSEQRRIVDLVGSIDRYIGSLQTQVEATRAARSALLAELLSDRSNDWSESVIGEVVSLQRRRIDPTRLGKDVKLLHWSIPGLDATGGPISDSASQIGSHKFQLSSDCVLLSLLNPRIPRYAIAEGGSDVVCSTEFAALTPKDAILLHFLACVVSAPVFLQQVLGLAQGTTKSRERVKPSDLLALPIRLPDLAEQQRIVDLIGSIDKQVSSLEALIDSTQSLRSGVLSELLSGERLLDESYDVAVSL